MQVAGASANYLSAARLERPNRASGSVTAQMDLPLNGPSDPYSGVVEGTNERQNPFIVVPRDLAARARTPAQVVEHLGRMDVLVSSEIPLINGYTAVMNEEERRKVEQAGYQVIPDLSDKFLLPNPWERKPDESAVDASEPAPPVTPRAPLSEPRFHTPLTQQFTGRGIGIAVVDTGIYPHPDFTFPHNRIVAFQDFVNQNTLPYDDNGHGTHTAGDAAGNGFMAEGLYRGPAPEANLIGVKVLDKNGNGLTSNILRGINWVVENKERYNIKVINLSLGSSQRWAFRKGDPIQQAVEKAVDAGITVVVSAGNEGPYPGSISAPGDNPRVITVGAVDDRNTAWTSDDRIPHFSSRGKAGSGKPDLVAPGEAIIGPNAPGTVTDAMARKYTAVNETLQWLKNMRDEELVHVPEDTLRLIGLNSSSIRRFKNSPYTARAEITRLIETAERVPMIKSNYLGMPGTSMAAPIVAGVVAQLLEANPHLTPDEIKDILRQSATPIPGYGPEAQGAGTVNPNRALELALKKLRDGDQFGQLVLPVFETDSARK
ncbi:MAG: S8 family peptidase [Candidatus Eremiobacterota bacterium]